MNVPVAHAKMVENATTWSIRTVVHVELVMLDETVKKVSNSLCFPNASPTNMYIYDYANLLVNNNWFRQYVFCNLLSVSTSKLQKKLLLVHTYQVIWYTIIYYTPQNSILLHL